MEATEIKERCWNILEDAILDMQSFDASLEALVRINSPRAKAFLHVVLEKLQKQEAPSRRYEMRRQAIIVSVGFSLARLGDRSVVPIVKAHLETQDNCKRLLAVGALTCLGDISVEAFKANFTDCLSEDKEAVISILSRMPADIALPILRDRLARGENDRDLKLRIVQELHKLRDQHAIPLFARIATSHEGLQIRSWAISGIGELGVLSDVRTLIQCLQDKDDTVKVSAITAIKTLYVRHDGTQYTRNLDTRKMMDELTVALKSKNKDVAVSAQHTLAILGDGNQQEILKRDLNDRSPLTRINAAGTLFKTGNKSVIPVLEEAMEHEDEYLRCGVISTFVFSADDAALPVLNLGLNDKHRLVRRTAIRVLTKNFGTSALPLFKKALSDTDWSVKVKAADKVLSLLNKA